MSRVRLRCLGGPWHDRVVSVRGHAREVEVPGNRTGAYVRWPSGPGETPVALTWTGPEGGWDRSRRPVPPTEEREDE